MEHAQSQVRQLARILLNRQKTTDAFPAPPMKEEIYWFDQGKHPGPTLNNFRICVTGQHARSEWNKHAARIFAQEFITYESAVTLETKDIEAAFLSHVAGSLVQQYKDIQNPPDDFIKANRVHAARRRTVRSYILSCRCFTKTF